MTEGCTVGKAPGGKGCMPFLPAFFFPGRHSKPAFAKTWKSTDFYPSGIQNLREGYIPVDAARKLKRLVFKSSL